MFDRVGKIDPVTRGMSILVHCLGIDLDVSFWSPHVSFMLVGCIVVTSIRGLLLTLTKVSLFTHYEKCYLFTVGSNIVLGFSFSTLYPVVNRPI